MKCHVCGMEMELVKQEDILDDSWRASRYECRNCNSKKEEERKEEIREALSRFEQSKEDMRLFMIHNRNADLMESLGSGDLYLLNPDATTFKEGNHVVITTLPSNEIDAERVRTIVLSYFRILREELGIKECEHLFYEQ